MVAVSRPHGSDLGPPDRKSGTTPQNVLFDAHGPRSIFTIYASDNQYRVLLPERPFLSNPGDVFNGYARFLDGTRLRSEDGAEAGPQTINQYGQLTEVTIAFTTAHGTSLGDAVQQITAIADS